jgi:hypothetical protein
MLVLPQAGNLAVPGLDVLKKIAAWLQLADAADTMGC